MNPCPWNPAPCPTTILSAWIATPASSSKTSPAKSAQQGVDCATAVRHGFAPDVIAEIVRNAEASRLIVGTHGRRGLKKFVLGSVARQLLDLVDIPVCTIGPRAHHLPAGGPAHHPAPGLAGWPA